MIDPSLAFEIAGKFLPRIRRFPRNRSAQVAIVAECGKLLADRCKTHQQAEDFCQQYQQPGQWANVEHFRAALEAATLSDLPLAQQVSLSRHAQNCITEPLRCGDKLIGWCKRPFPQALIESAANFQNLTLHQQAEIGLNCIHAMNAIEAGIWSEILVLNPDDRTALIDFAREQWPSDYARNPRWAQCLSFEEWRTRCG